MEIRITDISFTKIILNYDDEVIEGSEIEGDATLFLEKDIQPVCQFPKIVTEIKITTSDHKCYTVASHSLPWVRRVQGDSRGSYLFDRNTVSFLFRTTIEIKGMKLKYAAASKLKKGMVISRRRPLHFRNHQLTDGEISFPLKRPHGLNQWEHHQDIKFSQKVNPKCWLLFLQAISGLYFEKTLHMSIDAQILKQVVRARKTLSDFKLNPILGQCYKNSDMELVAIGANLLFTATNDSGKYYIVDSPEYGRGLYIFDDYQSAHDWATRKIHFREARLHARAFIPHVGKWNERVEAVL